MKSFLLISLLLPLLAFGERHEKVASCLDSTEHVEIALMLLYSNVELVPTCKYLDVYRKGRLLDRINVRKTLKSLPTIANLFSQFDSVERNNQVRYYSHENGEKNLAYVKTLNQKRKPILLVGYVEDSISWGKTFYRYDSSDKLIEETDYKFYKYSRDSTLLQTNRNIYLDGKLKETHFTQYVELSDLVSTTDCYFNSNGDPVEQHHKLQTKKGEQINQSSTRYGYQKDRLLSSVVKTGVKNDALYFEYCGSRILAYRMKNGVRKLIYTFVQVTAKNRQRD